MPDLSPDTPPNLAKSGREGEEEQFRLLALHLREVLWVADAGQTKIDYASPAYEVVWGRPRRTLVDDPRSFLDAVDPKDRERVASALGRRQRTGHYEEEYRIRRPDGSVRWIWDRGYPVPDAKGSNQHFVGISEDITGRKECEADRARLAAILECSEDAIVSMTVEGIVVNWNPGAERLYGYTAEEMIGRPISVLFAADHSQEHLEILEKVRKGERLAAYDTVRRRKDGTTITLSVDICPIMVREGEIVGASKIAHDITRIKQLEEQFRQAQKMEAIGRLAGGVAHDFNNLLTLICGYSDVVLKDLPPEGRARSWLTEIKKAGERGTMLTRQLLAVSRKQALEPKVLDLNEVVANCEKMLKRLVGEDVDLKAVLDPALGRVKTDPGQVEQVLMNLVVNARDAMPQGGKLTIETANVVLDRAYCRFHAGVQPGRYIMLSVSDTGCGMNAATQARIFEPFFTTKQPGEGTGLGLAMVYGFIKQSEGHVYVYSEPGLGSTFKIYLRQIEAVPPPAAPPADIESVPHGTETILLVEDETEVRAFARRVLETCGYTVLEAAHGGEAIPLAAEHPGPIHLLLSDVVMPELGGRRLAERIVALRPDIKVLYVSGYTTDAVVRHGVVESDAAFLQKPFTPSALTRKVREVLDL
jgi:two-component system, cell cycle sensor histidine kinase and response regulator CckA